MDTFSIGYLLGPFIVLLIVQRLLTIRRTLGSIQHHPGFRTYLSIKSSIGGLIPAIPGITPGTNYAFNNKFAIHEHFGWDIFTNVSLQSPEEITAVISNADAIKEIMSSRARFPKPVEDYVVLLGFGPNIVASEGETWKKYRKITSPAFNDKNNRLVWDAAVETTLDMFSTVWGDKDVVVIDHCGDFILSIALFVISVAGFGRKLVWDEATPPPGHQLTFREALTEVSGGIIFWLAFPKWVFGLTESSRAYDWRMRSWRYNVEMIAERRKAERKEERWDLFSSLMDANDIAMDGETPLTDREVMGNIFIFLLAGHETTAHSLSFALGLLAFYQEEQEHLYQHVKSILPDSRIPTYEEMPLFTQTLAVIYETLRMFPPVVVVPKISNEDTVLVARNSLDEKKIIPFPRGSTAYINIVGLHYNPRYWKDPQEFRPSRFRQPDWPRDAFIPFSGGARACIGRKFNETESVAILTILISRYKVTLKEEPQYAGETLEQKKERIFANKAGLTLTPIRIPLVFTRRT